MTKPGELTIEQPTKFQLLINLFVRTRKGRSKAAEHVIEQPVHFAMQGEEWTCFLAAPGGDIASAVPRNEISYGHLLPPLFSHGRRIAAGAARRPRSRLDHLRSSRPRGLIAAGRAWYRFRAIIDRLRRSLVFRL